MLQCLYHFGVLLDLAHGSFVERRTYGHMYKLAKAAEEGVNSIDGCTAVLYQVICLRSSAC
jgi:multimeric flavodoxin WrbA